MCRHHLYCNHEYRIKSILFISFQGHKSMKQPLCHNLNRKQGCRILLSLYIPTKMENNGSLFKKMGLLKQMRRGCRLKFRYWEKWSKNSRPWGLTSSVTHCWIWKILKTKTNMVITCLQPLQSSSNCLNVCICN